MPEIIKDQKTSSNEFYETIDPFVIDLIAVFDLIQEDVVKLLTKAEQEGWEPERLIREIEELI